MDLTLIIYGINVILAIWIVFLERKKPTAVFTWVLVLFFLPWLGFALYIIFGRRPSLWKSRAANKLEEDRQRTQRFLDITGLASGEVSDDEPVLSRYRKLTRLLEENEGVLTRGNDVVMFGDGYSLYRRMAEDIRNARHHVHVELFIIRNDDTGRRFLQHLVEKAREGVEVRLLYDDVGGRPPAEEVSSLEEAGGKVQAFFPSHVPWLRWLNVNVNYRNHRKIVVVDGVVGYTGGFNIGDEYLGKDPKLGRWRDTHVRLEGPAARSLQLRFFLDWNFASKEGVEPDLAYLPNAPSKDGTAVQVVSSGPMRHQAQIKEAYLRMIASADRSILIQTPYFIPDQSVMDLLRIASLSGVEVRIMVPYRRDQLLVHWASDSYLGELLHAGVRVYYYRGGFLHTKTITVDGCLVSIGSANWDIRGFELNFETNALIYGEEVAREHALMFERDLSDCQEMTTEEYDHRGLSRRIKESLSRLASPIL